MVHELKRGRPKIGRSVAAALRADGFVVVKDFFSEDETEQIRNAILSNGTRRRDLLSVPGLEWLVTCDGVVELAEELLGSPPVYFFESACTVGFLARGWHKDSRLEDRYSYGGPDWKQSPYPLLKFGVYPQDHLEHSAGLAVRKGSHLAPKSRRLWKSSLETVGRFLHQLTKKHTFLYLHMASDGAPVHVDSTHRDLIVWYLTTTHAGASMRPRFNPDRKLPPIVERLLPDRMFLPYSRDRCVALWAYSDMSGCAVAYQEYVSECDWYQEIVENSDLRIPNTSNNLTVKALTNEPPRAW